MRGNQKKAAAALFVLYGLIMLLLLFQRAPREGHPYNLTPLETIRPCVDLLLRRDPVALSLRPYAVINLVGNLVVFIPLGVFLPLLFRRQRSFLLFLATVIPAVCLVELLQLWTRRGALDIDDLILNVPGACLGWLGWWIWQRTRKR